MKKYSYIIFTFFVLISSCNKSDFLDEKPIDDLVIPKTLSDFQAILDNESVMNGNTGTQGLTSPIGDAGSDDFTVSDVNYSTFSEIQQNIYTWNRKIYTGSGEEDSDWAKLYRSIFYSNIVLDGLVKIKPPASEQQIYNQVQGSALFYRANMLWNLAQLFCPPFKTSSSSTDLGLPLKKTADINEGITRSSVKETYEMMIQDLKTAKDLLPATSTIKTRPSKNTVCALLARIYLNIGEYETALDYANQSLLLNNKLMDYSQIPLTSATANIFPKLNDEILFLTINNTASPASLIVFSTYGRVDPDLYNSYAINDLRKTLFYRSRVSGLDSWISFRGSYATGDFSGIANDEVYLIRAECYARTGNINLAFKDLNDLLRMRYTKVNGVSTLIDLTASNVNEAVKIVLNERRKELIMRGLRWSDLRRLNQQPEFAKTLNRTINGQTFSLTQNDPRYTYPIPLNVIGFNPDMPQNVR